MLIYLLSCGFLSGTTFCLCVMAIVFPLTGGSGFNVDSPPTQLAHLLYLPSIPSQGVVLASYVHKDLVLYSHVHSYVVMKYYVHICCTCTCTCTCMYARIYMYMYMQVCTMFMWIILTLCGLGNLFRYPVACKTL